MNNKLIRVLEVLNSPLLIKWFAVNPNPEFGSHPKLTAVPRGIRQNQEYIRILEENLRWDFKRRMSIKIRLTRCTIRPRKAPDLYRPQLVPETANKSLADERPYLTYVSFFMDNARSHRREYAKHFGQLGSSRWDEKTVSTGDFMEAVTRSKFVVSPVGQSASQ